MPFACASSLLFLCMDTNTSANFLFAIAMIINVDIANNFNLAFYTYITVTGPAFLILLFEKHSINELKNEFNLYNKINFFIAAFCWCLMLNSSIRAFQLGSVIVVASLFSITPILNSLVELIIYHNKEKIIKKIIISLLLILGVILVNM